MAGSLLADLAERSGMELAEPVRLEKRSRDELVSYLHHKLDEEMPEPEARATVAVYALLGLVPPDLDLRSVLLDLYTEQVAGFYDPDSTALFILDDQPQVMLQGLLIHELVHAVCSQGLGRRYHEVPAWMREGVASYLSRDWALGHSTQVVRFAVSGRYIPLARIQHGFPSDGRTAQFAYLESFAFVSWLAENHGEDSLRDLFDL